MAMLDRLDDPDVRRFVEAGGYGRFGGWVDGGFTTTDTGGPRRPSGGRYYSDGEYLTIDGTDPSRVPPGYEVIGQDDPADDSVNVGDTAVRDPGRLIAKRKGAPAASARSASPRPPARLNLDAIAAARAKADQIRRGGVGGSMANPATRLAPLLEAAGIRAPGLSA